MAESAAAKTPARPGAGGTVNKALTVILGFLFLTALGVVILIYKPDFVNKEVDSGGYEVLFQNLELTEASAIVESLKKQGVKNYKLKDDGKTILIPAKKKEQVALAIAKEGILPSGGSVGFEIFDKGGQLGATDFDKQVKFSRAISGELARSIARIYGVEEARVQVVIPAKQLFSTQQNPVQASVFIKVKEDELLSPAQISGIVSLVAGSVENLKRENVTVVDYHGRILSSDTYTKDYDRLLALLLSQKKGGRIRTTSLDQLDSTAEGIAAGAGAGGVKGFLDIYKKMDKQRQEKQEKELIKIFELKKNVQPENVYAAKLKFKEKYEEILEGNVKTISEQFFPRNAVAVKVNIELNDLKVAANATPNSLVSRITTMILLDENNKNVILTPEIKEALLKSVAAVIGYIKGRDRIDLRWAPMVGKYQKLWTSSLVDNEKVMVPKGTNSIISGKETGKSPVKINLDLLRNKPSWLNSSRVKYGSWAAGVLLLIFFGRSLLARKKAKPVDIGKSVFEEGEGRETDFQDLKNGQVGKLVEAAQNMARTSPNKLATVLEKWLQEE